MKRKRFVFRNNRVDLWLLGMTSISVAFYINTITTYTINWLVGKPTAIQRSPRSNIVVDTSSCTKEHM